MSEITRTPTAPFCEGSRLRPALLAVGFFVFFVGGWILTNAAGTPRRSETVRHLYGWLLIIFCGPVGLALLTSAFIPARLWISQDGFSFKQAWRKKAQVRWEEIERFWVLHQRGSSLVVWTTKQPTNGITKVVFGCDGWLPSGWALSAEEIEGELNLAKDKYDTAERAGA